MSNLTSTFLIPDFYSIFASHCKYFSTESDFELANYLLKIQNFNCLIKYL